MIRRRGGRRRGAAGGRRQQLREPRERARRQGAATLASRRLEPRRAQAENDELDKELARELEASEKVLSKATAAFEAATNKVLLTEEQPSTTSK